MFKNQYDTDVSTWSPQGRLYQVEYATEAVKQGSVTVGVKSSKVCVLASLKRAPQTDSTSYQSKSFTISNQCGVSVSGLISDARVLARFMRNEMMNHEYSLGIPMPITKLAQLVGDKCHVRTLSSSCRPFGVGLLMAGVDSKGIHLFQTCPTGHVYASIAAAIGSRCQSARTYLERHYATFHEASKEELIIHALKALTTTCHEGSELTCRNTSISVVTLDESFQTLNEASVGMWLKEIHMKPEDLVPEEPVNEALRTEDFQVDEDE